ncbi:hypothetical protein CIB84_013978, partial [Bambusicola thoracicus]
GSSFLAVLKKALKVLTYSFIELCVLYIKTYHGLYYPNVCTAIVLKSSTAAKDKLDYFYLLV